MFNILVVDDEPSVVQGLVQSVRWEEYGIDLAGTACNGLEALGAIERSPVHILLTDIRMPVMDGIELIREIRRRHLDIRTIILSGHDDFSYVKEGILLGVENYLLKPLDKDELASTLACVLEKLEQDLARKRITRESLDVFRNNLLSRWLSNDIGPREFQERAEVVGLPCCARQYQAAIVRYLASPGDVEIQARDSALSSLAREVFLPLQMLVCQVDSPDETVLLFWGDSLQDCSGIIRAGLLALRDRILAERHAEVFLSLGAVAQGPDRAWESYRSAKALQDYSLILPPGTLVDEHMGEQWKAGRRTRLTLQFDRFCGSIQEGRSEDAIHMVREILSHMDQAGGVTPQEFRNVLLETVYHISSTVRRSIRDESAIPSELKDLFASMDRLHNHDELVHWLHRIIRTASDVLARHSDAVSPLVRLVLKQVRQNFNRDLSLKTLASQLNVTPSHLGQLFKIETGEMFTNYLNRVRIEKAKELLAITQTRTSDIAEQVGYFNQSYFFKVFRKVTGLSPVEFRDRHAREGTWDLPSHPP